MFCSKIKNYRNLLTIGWISLVAGIVGSYASIHLGGLGMISPFWQGLITGLACFLLGASIVFNIKGFQQYKLAKQTAE